MSRLDRIALLLSLVGVLLALLVAERVFESMAHIEDEMAYVWQAQVIARGQLTVPTPPQPKSFLMPFVVDYEGQRFGKYPLGWPVVLALGVRLGLRSLVNPLLAGLGIWLTYLLGKRTLGEPIALLAAGLTLTSPFFLINSGSLLSHPYGLVLSAAFALAWLDAFWHDDPSHSRPASRLWLATIVAALALGVLALTRPMTAVGVGLPFGLHGLYLLLRGDRSHIDAGHRPNTRLRLVTLGVIALAVASLHFVWQYAVTGDPFLNPYTLWWEYDKIGFGPGVGRLDEGHSPEQALINTRHSLQGGVRDMFGWGLHSWVILPVGLLALWRNRKTLLLAGVFPGLVGVYMLYWIGATLFGPRYYYEGLYSLTLTAAAGIFLLAGWPLERGSPWPAFASWQRVRTLLVAAALVGLTALNLFFYLPGRLGDMHGLYGVERARLAPFFTSSAAEFTPALVIVHPKERWTEYGALLELANPFFDTPFVFVISRGQAEDTMVARLFPDRGVYHYYPDDPYRFYTGRRHTPSP